EQRSDQDHDEKAEGDDLKSRDPVFPEDTHETTLPPENVLYGMSCKNGIRDLFFDVKIALSSAAAPNGIGYPARRAVGA
ncbi:MAG: hypothetical protein IKS52_10725, partial [Clostridia bacterium]|nr:hypothetical protein [Clostridia bacterium]